MRISIRSVLCAAFLPLAWTAACGGDNNNNSATAPPAALPPDIEALRAALDPYTSLGIAKNAGYAAITDCMSNGDEGAMGVHFGKTSIFDGVTDPLQPEVLIYEPGNDGEMSLVGVEFVVPYSVLPKTSPAPTLFGQQFLQNDVFQLWGLHVWTHRANPSGLFASWNPRVHC